MTAAATTGPASAPRPTSSTPAMKRKPLARASSSNAVQIVETRRRRARGEGVELRDEGIESFSVFIPRPLFLLSRSGRSLSLPAVGRELTSILLAYARSLAAKLAQVI